MLAIDAQADRQLGGLLLVIEDDDQLVGPELEIADLGRAARDRHRQPDPRPAKPER